MTNEMLQRWSSPTRTLIVKDERDDSLQTMQVIRQARASQQQLNVAHLIRRFEASRVNQSFGGLGFNGERPHESARLAPDVVTRQGSACLSDFLVLDSAAGQEIPRLARALDVDRVVVAAHAPHVPLPGLAASWHPEECLLPELHVPLWIPAKQMHADLNIRRSVRVPHILLALSFHDNFEVGFEFACCLALAHQARLTVLHVFEGTNPVTAARDRSPLTIMSRLPVAELKREGQLCPMEIVIRDGDPATRILDSVEKQRYDLIVMGARGKRRRGGACYSQAVRRVVAEAVCPIVLIGSTAATLQPALAMASDAQPMGWDACTLPGNERTASHELR